MLKLNTIATGSSGNSYALQFNDEILLLDAGIPFKQIKKGIDYQISNVVAAVISHKHL